MERFPSFLSRINIIATPYLRARRAGQQNDDLHEVDTIQRWLLFVDPWDDFDRLQA